MEQALQTFSDGVAIVDEFVWGWAMIVLLIGTHIFMTIRTKGIQRKLGTGIKLSVKGTDPHAEGDVSQFGALTSALAATIGTGNIVGVATALLAGGPGAIFWMWITGIFGIATKYSEAYIGIKFRVKDHKGEMLGGPMYALARGFKVKWLGRALGAAFCAFTVIASFGTGGAVQSNALSGIVTGYVDVPPIALSVIVTILVAVVILGGIKTITKVTEKLIPLMSALYALGCIIIIIINHQFFCDAVMLILDCAFTGKAAFGGAVGSGIMLALQYGFKRGLFSNESGLGSAPLISSAAVTKNPARQALVSMTGTFWDTVIVCAITGLMLTTTMLANPDIQAAVLAGNIQAGADLATTAFRTIPVLGPIILVFGMVCFSYSTILGWGQYGNRCITYLFGKHAILPYQIVFLIFVFSGCITDGGLVWNISDITNALMAIPNCIAVLVLSGLIAKGTQHYVYDKNLDEYDETPIPLYENK